MKKILTMSFILLAGLSLTACGSNSSQDKENSSLKAENASLKAGSRPDINKFNDQEYALAAYLKLQGQNAKDLRDNINNMHWSRKDNTYSIDFGAHSTTMTVNKDNVEVTYDDVEGDHMGSGNGHKTYSKAKLFKIIEEQRNGIDDILKSYQSNLQNQNTTQSTQTSNTNTQSTKNDNARTQSQSAGLNKGSHDATGHSTNELSQRSNTEEASSSVSSATIPANNETTQQDYGGQ
ncbi:hypothetical protein [Limosilactobacillus coleohominis]|uniref:Lipoprotein n=1 Tax=Limosilactobacillus coleohominis TaxID=181675 RepID=A0ABS2GY21_9LACO|nr:hypothetical protein [Limosilactobacillus coleohominis]MBM6941190.1 hypothetical protein [Limosilactobacillus coleohominis]